MSEIGKLTPTVGSWGFSAFPVTATFCTRTGPDVQIVRETKTAWIDSEGRRWRKVDLSLPGKRGDPPRVFCMDGVEQDRE